MAEISLKEYASKIAELEAAVYTQKKLMTEHGRLLQSRIPKAPMMKQLVAPKEPEIPGEYFDKQFTPGVVGFLVGLAAFGVFALCCLGIIGFILGPAALLVMVFFIIWGRNVEKAGRAADIEACEKYRKEMAEYPHKKEMYEKELAEITAVYNAENAAYQVALAAYNVDRDTTMERHNNVLAALEEALHAMYDQNVIYPKYRNMVAITTISEYLASGRCSELEGPGGAYNLYEMELRQNIVINQLTSIVSNLEQIRNNQFLLYQELTKANATVNGILSEIKSVNDNTRLTAYFAGVTAMIEASPKVYIGHTF